jgi:hypothetical protein
MEFAEKQQISLAVERVWENVVSKLDRGDVLLYDAMVEAGGFDRGSVHYPAFIKRIRNKILRERGIAIRPVNDVGYKLLTSVDQVVRCSKDRNRRISRQAFMASKEVANADVSELPIELQKLRALQEASFKEQRSTARKQVRTIFKTETNPRRPIEA